MKLRFNEQQFPAWRRFNLAEISNGESLLNKNGHVIVKLTPYHAVIFYKGSDSAAMIPIDPQGKGTEVIDAVKINLTIQLEWNFVHG